MADKNLDEDRTPPMRDDEISIMTNKPFHLMTPAERTAARIAENRAISEKISEKIGEGKTQRPPVQSTGDFIRATPAERAKLGSVIRKVQS
ncbi:MAG TPA: hypothetical protein VHZ07_02635 [Bryobacteraceae bacterium]|jgi:hypothetical protein|nr:hypothetical protein [Bryobacteraceae bacterium]